MGVFEQLTVVVSVDTDVWKALQLSFLYDQHDEDYHPADCSNAWYVLSMVLGWSYTMRFYHMWIARNNSWLSIITTILSVWGNRIPVYEYFARRIRTVFIKVFGICAVVIFIHLSQSHCQLLFWEIEFLNNVLFFCYKKSVTNCWNGILSNSSSKTF